MARHYLQPLRIGATSTWFYRFSTGTAWDSILYEAGVLAIRKDHIRNTESKGLCAKMVTRTRKNKLLIILREGVG
jgi:hypothetical protein